MDLGRKSIAVWAESAPDDGQRQALACVLVDDRQVLDQRR
jgi:hypothetical protein